MPCVLICTLLGASFVSGASAEEQFSKVRAFLKKNQTCYFAVGMFEAAAPASLDPNLSEDVFCVMDTVMSKGTLKEKAGCGLVILNVSTGNIRKATFNLMMPQAMVYPLILEGIRCKNAGFVKLLETRFKSGYGQGPKAKEVLFNGLMQGIAKTIVIYSASDGALKAYNSAIAALESELRIAEATAAAAKKAEEQEAIAKREREAQMARERLKHIDGNWTRDCREDLTGNWMKESALFHDGRFEMTTNYYTKNCEKPRFTINSSGTYRLGPEIKSPDHIRNLDLRVEKGSVLPETADVASEFAADRLGGRLDWAEGASKELSTLRSFKDLIGRTSFGIVRLDGNTLYYGDGAPVYEQRLRSGLNLNISKPWKRKVPEDAE